MTSSEQAASDAAELNELARDAESCRDAHPRVGPAWEEAAALYRRAALRAQQPQSAETRDDHDEVTVENEDDPRDIMGVSGNMIVLSKQAQADLIREAQTRDAGTDAIRRRSRRAGRQKALK